MYFLEEYWMHHCLLNGSPHWMTSLFSQKYEPITNFYTYET